MSHYCLHCGKELEDHQFLCPSCSHNVYLDSLDEKVVNASAALTAAQIEANTQWVKYRCGKNGSTGHGFAAEDANALNDILNFKDVDFSGRENSKDGADRIVDGTPIQTKYYANAQASLEAAFDPQTGMYRYTWDKGNTPLQTLEVPKDQYEQVVECMKEKIRDGKVQGVTDPSQATKLVKCGDYTYQQAKNIAKAGNIDSLKFDAKLNAVVALGAFGVSFAIRLSVMAMSCRTSQDLNDAVKLSFLIGLQNGTITLASSVMAMQLLRTSFGRSFSAAMRIASKNMVDGIYKTQVGKNIVHAVAKNVLNKSVFGCCAKNSAKKILATKVLGTNFVTNTVCLVVTSIPDAYRCFVANSISKPQFMKNLVVSSTGLAGATVGYFIGARFGSGAAGALIGGALLPYIGDKVIGIFHKEDSEKMQELVKIALLQLSSEYLLQSQDEFEDVIEIIANEKAIDTNMLRVMYTVGQKDNNDEVRVELAKECLRYYFDCAARQKKTLHLIGKDEYLLRCINELADDEHLSSSSTEVN